MKRLLKRIQAKPLLFIFRAIFGISLLTKIYNDFFFSLPTYFWQIKLENKFLDKINIFNERLKKIHFLQLSKAKENYKKIFDKKKSEKIFLHFFFSN